MSDAPQGSGHLAIGMGTSRVAPDWPPLTEDEVGTLLAGYDLPGAGPGTRWRLRWHSPRPFSAAARAGNGAVEVLVKRHHVSVRTLEQLAVEHAFGAHLRQGGIPVPAAVPDASGATAVGLGAFVYEVHELAAGIDAYAEAASWTGWSSLGHAAAAGAALARLHEAAAGFPLAPRPFAVLVPSLEVVAARSPLEALEALAVSRPALGAALAGWPWREDLGRHLATAMVKARARLEGLPARWGHGDWHGSNLTWTAAGPEGRVAGVLDLGLSNRTCAAYDLAVAIERSCVDWLALTEGRRAVADLEAVDALLGGYASYRPLDPAEEAALADLLPVAHVELALAELEYFAGVVASAELASLAYEGYLLGHAAWFAGADGSALLDHLRRPALPATAGPPRGAAPGGSH